MQLYTNSAISLFRRALDEELKRLGADELFDYRGIQYKAYLWPSELEACFIMKNKDTKITKSTFLAFFRSAYAIKVKVDDGDEEYYALYKITNNYSRYTFHTGSQRFYTEDSSVLSDEGYAYDTAIRHNSYAIRMRFRIKEVTL